MTDYAALRPYATGRQLVYIDAILEHGGIKPAARVTGVTPTTIRGSIASVQRKARSDAVDIKEHRPGFVVKDVSTSYDADDNVTATHVKEGREGPFEDGGIGEGPARDGHSGYKV